jgi:hypothetical protein
MSMDRLKQHIYFSYTDGTVGKLYEKTSSAEGLKENNGSRQRKQHTLKKYFSFSHREKRRMSQRCGERQNPYFRI